MVHTAISITIARLYHFSTPAHRDLATALKASMLQKDADLKQVGTEIK